MDFPFRRPPRHPRSARTMMISSPPPPREVDKRRKWKNFEYCNSRSSLRHRSIISLTMSVLYCFYNNCIPILLQYNIISMWCCVGASRVPSRDRHQQVNICLPLTVLFEPTVTYLNHVLSIPICTRTIGLQDSACSSCSSVILSSFYTHTIRILFA
jgi:hypothetical protein